MVVVIGGVGITGGVGQILYKRRKMNNGFVNAIGIWKGFTVSARDDSVCQVDLEGSL